MISLKNWRKAPNGVRGEKTDVPPFEEIFKQIKINFGLSGMPFGRQTFCYGFLFPYLSLLVVVGEEIAFFVSKIAPENILELTELAPCTVTGMLSLLKISCIFFKRNKVFRLTHNLETLYNGIRNDPAKICVIQKEILVLKTFIKYFFILNGILISIYNFSTLFIMSYQYLTNQPVELSLPYSVIVPYAVDSWTSWLITYLHIIYSGFVCVVYYTTVDALFIILTSQVCFNFKVLSNELKNFTTNEDGSLNEFVKKHQYILQLSDDLEDIFKGPNFFSVLAGSLLICALGFNLMTGGWAQMPGVVLFLSSVLLQILMMSMFGENLICESQKIAESAFFCKWYEMDVKTRKIILLIRERARRPQKLTAYNFSVISFTSFTKIISTSWSYFTILKTVYKPSEIHQ